MGDRPCNMAASCLLQPRTAGWHINTIEMEDHSERSNQCGGESVSARYLQDNEESSSVCSEDESYSTNSSDAESSSSCGQLSGSDLEAEDHHPCHIPWQHLTLGCCTAELQSEFFDHSQYLLGCNDTYLSEIVNRPPGCPEYAKLDGLLVVRRPLTGAAGFSFLGPYLGFDDTELLRKSCAEPPCQQRRELRSRVLDVMRMAIDSSENTSEAAFLRNPASALTDMNPAFPALTDMYLKQVLLLQLTDSSAEDNCNSAITIDGLQFSPEDVDDFDYIYDIAALLPSSSEEQPRRAMSSALKNKVADARKFQRIFDGGSKLRFEDVACGSTSGNCMNNTAHNNPVTVRVSTSISYQLSDPPTSSSSTDVCSRRLLPALARKARFVCNKWWQAAMPRKSGNTAVVDRAERDQRFTFSLLDSFENFPQLRAAVTEIEVQIEVERRGTSTVRSMTVPVALSIWEIEPRSKTVYSHVEKVVGYKEFMDQIYKHVHCTLQELRIGNESDTAEMSNVSASLAAAAEAGQWRTGFRGAYTFARKVYLGAVREREQTEYVFLNVQNDAGDEGLRTVKRRYQPVEHRRRWRLQRQDHSAFDEAGRKGSD